MKLNYNSLFGRQQAAQSNPSAPIILFTLLTIGRIVPSEQNNNHNDRASALDEEISLFYPVHDYDRSNVNPATDDAAQPKHENLVKAESNYHGRQHSLTHNPQSDQNDPFAVTFEDYLSEWSANGPNHRADDQLPTEGSSHHRAITRDGSAKSEVNIEEEENLVKPDEAAASIDYIFPAPKAHDSAHRGRYDDRVEPNNQHENIDSKTSSPLDEVKLLFAWKQLPTNKCSKTCGRGLRVYHISCIDLKFNVRVQNELCHKSNLPRPSETSDEPCNEIDCPAEWLSIESHRCEFEAPNTDCKPRLYKRAQCSMISKTGALVYLDESKCNSAKSLEVVQEETSREDKKKEEYISSSDGEENVDIYSEGIGSYNENNDIVANIDSIGTLKSLLSESGKTYETQLQDEPYFFVGNWSECSGATCGQLGKRTRRVSCRLNLSRSSRITELPVDSCNGQTAPFSEEPCYMHCPEVSENKTVASVQIFDNDGDAETIYDLEMTRFIWKTGGWTKCSTDCLGGRRESIIECWDKTTESVVDASSCDAELKPQVVTETCNDVPCPAEWRVGSWSRCSKPCGSAGTRTRTISCVQQVPRHEGITYMVVSNDLCISVNGSVQSSSEACNRHDCKPEWSVGPWSECNRKCGEGTRNRTLICMQEFASRDGPQVSSTVFHAQRRPSADLLEAVTIGAKDWHPGKAVQVPFEECFEEYRTVPPLEEFCFSSCGKEPYIDADIHQNYRMSQEFMKKKTVTLKVGGRAQIFEGKNLKIQCKILNRQRSENLVRGVLDQVEWRKDGIKIFSNNSTVSDKQYFPDDNSISGRDVYSDEKNHFMADEPKQRRSSAPTASSRARHLSVRSWNNYHGSHSDSQGNFHFSHPPGGRFSLIRETTLRIKKLRTEDSGTYTCYYGSQSESLNLKVVGQKDIFHGL